MAAHVTSRVVLAAAIPQLLMLVVFLVALPNPAAGQGVDFGSNPDVGSSASNSVAGASVKYRNYLKVLKSRQFARNQFLKANWKRTTQGKQPMIWGCGKGTKFLGGFVNWIDFFSCG
jgi:hypothetical protein